ncbi:MAG: M16 family metallopeptidase [Terriglobales bacterium]
MKSVIKFHFSVLLVLLLGSLAVAQTKGAGMAPKVVTVTSPSPLYHVQVMVRTGSASDPAGKEGLTNLVARAMLEGGFGDPKNPVTKERLAEITRPWGSAALPMVRVDKQATTFRMTVPKDVWPQFVNTILKPMMTQPLFQANEIERLRKEALTAIQSRLRLEQQEMLGLEAVESYIFAGTRFQHVAGGTVQGLNAITRDDLQNHFRTYFTGGNMIIAASFTDAAALDLLKSAVPQGGGSAQPEIGMPQKIAGRELLIVTQPNAIATGIHFGFPIPVKRGDPDYWPLFVANTWLGTHRDDFSHLYQVIRADRGYNYGDYSYIEYLAARPFSMFPPPTTPRSQQYFSVWIRPVADKYAHFVLKAATYEVDQFVRNGLTPEQVEAAKIKARTLYLNYAENTMRQLGYRLDDVFYGMEDRGYLNEMLKNVDAVTPDQVNAAIRKHLQTANLRYVITTNEKFAEKLADDIASNTNCTPKTLEEYHITEPVPPGKQKLLEQDKQWIAYPLNIKRSDIRIVKAEQMFETAAVPGITPAAAQGATP